MGQGVGGFVSLLHAALSWPLSLRVTLLAYHSVISLMKWLCLLFLAWGNENVHLVEEPRKI